MGSLVSFDLKPGRLVVEMMDHILSQTQTESRRQGWSESIIFAFINMYALVYFIFHY